MVAVFDSAGGGPFLEITHPGVVLNGIPGFHISHGLEIVIFSLTAFS